MPADWSRPRYLAGAHGGEPGFLMGLESGEARVVDGVVHGQRLARRPSVTALPDDGWMFACSCAPGPLNAQGVAHANPRLQTLASDVPIHVLAGSSAPTPAFFMLPEREPGSPGQLVRFTANDGRPTAPNMLFRQVTDPGLWQYTDVLPSADGAVLVPAAYLDDTGPVGSLVVDGRTLGPAAAAEWITAQPDWRADGSALVVLLGGGDGRRIGRFSRALAAELDKAVGAQLPRVMVLSAEHSVLHGTDNRITAGRPRLGDGSGTLSMVNYSGDGWTARRAEGAATELDADLAVALHVHGVELRPRPFGPDLPTVWNEVREYVLVPDSFDGLSGHELTGGAAFFGPYDPRDGHAESWWDDEVLQRVRGRLGLSDAFVVKVKERAGERRHTRVLRHSGRGGVPAQGRPTLRLRAAAVEGRLGGTPAVGGRVPEP